MEAFDRVAEAVFNKELTGQKDIEIPTKSAILTCRKAKGTSIVKHPMAAGNAIVKFPDIDDLFGNKAVDVQLLYIPTNPFTWDKSSELVTTSILDVKIKEAQGSRRVINISNLADEIELQIPFEPLSPESAPDVFFKQSDNESIQYHTFEIEDTNKAIEFYVKPKEKQEQLTILVKYGKKPTISEHDLQVKLPNFSSCSLPIKLPFEDNNCTESPYGIFLPSTYLTEIGTYYIGVKYEGEAGNQSGTHSRERRDCGGGVDPNDRALSTKIPLLPNPIMESLRTTNKAMTSLNTATIPWSSWAWAAIFGIHPLISFQTVDAGLAVGGPCHEP
ncbi:hypothetical protein OS493_015608 [Desmophyllum pertusum]|uniref:Uncharacterized protein n=1 Tax=Desmophyllum pertusum TaxID=174260 RepID=A0A9X0CKS0_9CNID|nr:hypothetical protein OS493_015608 [Desmophyllum pertusum]